MFASRARSGLDPAAAFGCITKDAVLGSYADVVCGFVHGWAPRDRSSARREALKAPPLRCAQVVFWCSLPKLATDRSRSAYVLFVEDRSYARRERGDRWSFRAGARGGLRVLTFQCSLRPGPACAFWGGQATCYKTAVDFDLQNVGPVRRRLSSELVDFACGSRVEDSVFLQYARTGMTPHDALCECGVNDRRYAKISDRKLMTPT